MTLSAKAPKTRPIVVHIANCMPSDAILNCHRTTAGKPSGTSLSGGRGSILGTVLGGLIMGILNNGLFLLDVSPFWQQVIKGLVILAAVAADKMGSKER